MREIECRQLPLSRRGRRRFELVMISLWRYTQILKVAGLPHVRNAVLMDNSVGKRAKLMA